MPDTPLDEFRDLAVARFDEDRLRYCRHEQVDRQCLCRRRLYDRTFETLLWAWDRGLIRLPEETP